MDDTILDQNLSTSQFAITAEIKTYLRETAKWAKFLSIIGYVFVALIFILGLGVALFSGFFLSTLGEAGSNVPSGMFGAVGFIYVLMALLYLIPINYMYKFSSKMKTALLNDDQQILSDSFRNLKSLYKFMGIFVAVIFGIYAFIFLISIVAGLFAGF